MLSFLDLAITKIIHIKKMMRLVTVISRVIISCLFLRFVLIFKGNVIENVNVLISKKRAYF